MRSVRSVFNFTYSCSSPDDSQNKRYPWPEIPEDRGAMGLSQALKRLDVIGSVLHTGGPSR